jgi:predicted nucleic acid-binding protein
MLILDTNVLSELLKPSPDGRVVDWLDRQPRQQLFTTVITRAEIQYGIALLPRGARRQKLAEAAQSIFDVDLADHVLGFDSAAADRFAEIAVKRKTAGKPISQFDGMIAAIAATHRASLATRNVRDFESCGIELEHPWGG